ncbi:hypothetical protein D3C81_1523760 [compost metagenome]
MEARNPISELQAKELVGMNYITKYVGLDVSKETIAVAVAETGRDAARYVGAIKHEAGAIRKLLKQLGKKEDLEICYEAGPTGYGLHRMLTSLGVRCMVVAPSLIPVRRGDQVKDGPEGCFAPFGTASGR